MRTLQAHPRDTEAAIERARALGCSAIAWTLDDGADRAAETARRAGLETCGWYQAARDPVAARTNPHWMHAPQHHEWLRRFPEYSGGHPALVAPYIGLNTRAAAEHARSQAYRRIADAVWAKRLFLGDIQGPPMGCGCGNPCCRSWDNAPGPKLASTPYDRPVLLFPVEFVAALKAALPDRDLVPVLCPECERGVRIDGIDDPDGPEGTDLCQGVPCVSPCATLYWPSLLTAFRGMGGEVGLLLLTRALGKEHPVFGGPRAWAERAHRHYGVDLLPAVEPEDAARFDRVLILTDAPQDVHPVEPPADYVPDVPAIRCGYCPP
ncbi:MAG: hypothetical protein SFU56_13505 [Capsulimonadales bacterium]|nr:hypothetical protein [Capsulimonadales bacterium]